MSEVKDEKPVKQLNLKVVNADGEELLFKIKETTVLKKVHEAYCSKKGLHQDSVRFLLNGKFITAHLHQTARELEMEDEDQIEAVMQQVGGSI
eukprot:TRINITY_DN5473_c0_g1_i2.p1 TRINITY_DN5473_c0_g1~~TRINITY_DN5473_c0_g1_i2.p1  ORF type:complete len:106 (-),score=11.78 TRINITY_DN5473_c0_g1_i2:35-313(-)